VKKQFLTRKLVLSRETVHVLDLGKVSGGVTEYSACDTCTSRTSANSVCRTNQTGPLCE
jgi:hypothetical protein